MDTESYMKSCRNSIIALIKKYRATKDAIVMENLQRMLEWRRDIIKHKEFKQGKGIVRMTELYY